MVMFQLISIIFITKTIFYFPLKVGTTMSLGLARSQHTAYGSDFSERGYDILQERSPIRMLPNSNIKQYYLGNLLISVLKNR